MYEDDMYRQVPRRNPMATASIVLGILSLVFCTLFYLALPCGALAVICAILSRTDTPLPGKSKAGIVCGICGMIATAIITVAMVRTVFTNPDMRSYLEYYFQLYTGDPDFDLEQELENLLPFSFDGDSSEENGSDDDSDYDLPVTIPEGEEVLL